MALTNGQLEHLSCNNATVKFSKGSQILTQGALSTNVIYLRKWVTRPGAFKVICSSYNCSRPVFT